MTIKDTKTICYYVQNLADNDLDNTAKTMYYDKASAINHLNRLKLLGVKAKLISVEISTITNITERIISI